MFRGIGGTDQIAALAARGDRHAYGIVQASRRLGSRVEGFGGYGKFAGDGPDIFVRGGLKNPNAMWVEVKSVGRSVGDQFHRFTNQFGQRSGEYAFHGGRVPGGTKTYLTNHGFDGWWWEV